MKQLCHRTYKQKSVKKELGYKKSKEWSIFYSNPQWKTLREWYRTEHPLCEACLMKERSVPMEEVHHLHIFRTGKTTEEKWALFLNPKNLCSLCTYHHKLIHNMMRECNTEAATLEQLIKYEERKKNTEV